MKTLSVKQAEKWLEKVKTVNPNSYKELSKELKKYEKRNDEYDCFVKMNKTLLSHPDLTQEINNYLDEGNKFVVNIPEVERINTLMKHIKKSRPEIYQQISNAIKNMTSDESEEKQDHEIKDFVFNSVKGIQQLEAYANTLLNFTPEGSIYKLNLDHLKNSKQSSLPEEILQEEIKAQPKKKVKLHAEPVITEKVKEYPNLRKLWPYPTLTSPGEEKNFIRSFEKKIKPGEYAELVKILHVYALNIISKNQVIELMRKAVGADQDFEYLADILEARETDRRRNSCFKPLIDYDFQSAQRGSHSYVATPSSYPTFCSNKDANLRSILNDKWISIPRGSEDFNVRSKNAYEFNLLKAEDERYEFDLYSGRLKKASGILNKIVSGLEEDPTKNFTKELNLLLSLGIFQLIYKNASREQKEEFEWFLKRNTLETVKLFHDRVRSQILELQDIKNIHGLRSWSDVASKNWTKSQDFKGFAFKKNEKQKMKPSVFLNQLNFRLRYLSCKGELATLENPFQNKKQFFSVFNSFESTSRIQKCVSRKIQTPIVYDMKEHKIPTLLPAMIMSFEDKQACEFTYSLVVYYLENSGIPEGERLRCRNFFRLIMKKFFNWNSFKCRSISAQFDEEAFYAKVFSPSQQSQTKIDNWINEQPDFDVEEFGSSLNPDLPNFKALADSCSQFIFEPPKSKENKIFYSSEQFYIFVRFLYALYERVIRISEIADNPQKIRLFEILYYFSIKTKESLKFEDCLNSLFSNHAHIFSTIYKLMENLVKSLSLVSLCSLTNESIKYMNIDCQQIYILLFNKYYLLNSVSNSKIMRFVYQLNSKLMYINCIDSYYKTDEQVKDIGKRRQQIAKDIELYTVEGITDHRQKQKSHEKNGFEYCFQGNTIKMLNLHKNEDMMVRKRTGMKKKEVESDIKKVYKFWKQQQ